MHSIDPPQRAIAEQFPGSASLNYAKPLQHVDELEGLIAVLKREGVRRYMEIGVRYGGTFEAVMRALGEGAFGLAVDFPGGPFGDKASIDILLAALWRLRNSGISVEAVFGPSGSREVLEKVREMGPFDAILIDGDHSYAAAELDFIQYAPLARLVIFHDIAAPDSVRSRDGRPVDVPLLWNHLKQKYQYEEIVTPDSLMGIGILYMDRNVAVREPPEIEHTGGNPNGRMVPLHIGQMYYDHINEIFYQARGVTQFNWHFVPPSDMVGSFVKIYNFFVGAAAHDPRGAEIAQKVLDAESVKETMCLSGAEIMHALFWETASGADVLQTRIRFHRNKDIVLFIGFSRSAKAHTMPISDGVTILNGVARCGDKERALASDTVLFRLERLDGTVTAFMDDEPLGTLANISGNPVIALFNLDQGRRPISDGYGAALQRNLNEEDDNCRSGVG